MIGDGLRQVRKGVTPFPHSKSHYNPISGSGGWRDEFETLATLQLGF